MSGMDEASLHGTPAIVREVEGRVAEFWGREGIPGRALTSNPRGPTFRFTEGPPTANGVPHMGHLLTRALKDVILRYRRMRGYAIVSSMAGWDCHGLPVEIEVEKTHGWKNKEQILTYGLDRFGKECRTSVMKYEGLWREMSRRVGYWLDYDNPYFTMDKSYVESVWWSLKELYNRGFLEKGSYIVPYCPRCETPEAAHEVAQGYREIDDPSVTVKFRILGRPRGSPGRSLLVWTTTPWTLPSNLALAVDPEMTYVVISGEGTEEYVMGEAAMERYFPSPGPRPRVLERISGKSLLGDRYHPLFEDGAPGGEGRHTVYPAEFVKAEEGTGIVHIAPSFGADDSALGERYHLGFFDPLDASGRFTNVMKDLSGTSFKAADPILLEQLRERSLLWREDRIRHTYPFCYRCGNPLMYRALETWFVRTHRVTEKLLENNSGVTWIPSHIRNGRFGNFLSEGKDWALSRNRFWGTPLPIWNCPQGHSVVVGSFEEFSTLTGASLPSDFDPHRPSVDSFVLKCKLHGAAMTREPYVIDCWYDSGSAPFAQFHFPFDKSSPFDPGSPLDFIAEGLDQTRGWFYAMLVISTLIFDRKAYKNVIVNGMVLDEKGQKQSKSKGNVSDPMVMMEKMGADAARLAAYLGPYTEPFRFSEYFVRTTGSRILTTLVNVVEFYRSNRVADRYVPDGVPPHPAGILDRWLLSQLEGLAETVDRALEVMDLHTAATEIERFVESLSTWYLRRSRNRFWNETLDQDKRDAYATLSFTLTTLSRISAPMIPHVAEYVFHMATAHEFRKNSPSVHLEPWPVLKSYRDRALEEAMKRVISVVEAGRNLRMKASVKSRIPLSDVVVSGLPVEDLAMLGGSIHELVSGELNVKRVTLLTSEEFAVRQFPEDSWVVLSTAEHLTIALSRKPTRELFLEGLSREMIRRIQTVRKEKKLEYTDRVDVRLFLGPNLKEALQAHRDLIVTECQITRLETPEGYPDGSGEGFYEWGDVGGDRMVLELRRSEAPPSAHAQVPWGAPPRTPRS